MRYGTIPTLLVNLSLLSALLVVMALGTNSKGVLAVCVVVAHYGDGMADSRLVIPAARAGTARNINTIAKLVQLSAAGQARPGS